MFDRFLGGIEYYDFPSFEMALFSLLLAFVLSTFVAFVYKYTHEDAVFSNSFFQSMVLSSMVSAMVMMAVADNLAAGFGIIGAVAIVRFRTRMQNPRNIIFIFATLSIGIATGVYGYAIAIAGTIIFCLVAILLYFTPYGSGRMFSFQLTIDCEPLQDISIIKSRLEAIAKSCDLKEIRDDGAKKRLVFAITSDHAGVENTVIDAMKALGATNVRVVFDDNINVL